MSRYLLRGRRRGPRRADDPAACYVDRPDGLLVALLAAIFLFQILDSGMTIAHIRRGGTELNPVMDWLLQRSDGLFVGVKLTISAVGLAFLGIHKNFPYARHGLVALFLLFLGVVGWQVFLVLQAV